MLQVPATSSVAARRGASGVALRATGGGRQAAAARQVVVCTAQRSVKVRGGQCARDGRCCLPPLPAAATSAPANAGPVPAMPCPPCCASPPLPAVACRRHRGTRRHRRCGLGALGGADGQQEPAGDHGPCEAPAGGLRRVRRCLSRHYQIGLGAEVVGAAAAASGCCSPMLPPSKRCRLPPRRHWPRLATAWASRSRAPRTWRWSSTRTSPAAPTACSGACVCSGVLLMHGVPARWPHGKEHLRNMLPPT